jgi:LPXTG-motif cell wall-anchored protein
LIASVSFDRTGSYDAVFTVFIGVALIAAILLWLAKKPARPVRSSACT